MAINIFLPFFIFYCHESIVTETPNDNIVTDHYSSHPKAFLWSVTGMKTHRMASWGTPMWERWLKSTEQPWSFDLRGWAQQYISKMRDYSGAAATDSLSSSEDQWVEQHSPPALHPVWLTLSPWKRRSRWDCSTLPPCQVQRDSPRLGIRM